MKKRFLIATGLLVLAAAAAGILRLHALLPVATGYHAKMLCSAVFVSGRQPGEVSASELNFSLVRFVSGRVDTVGKTVTSRLLWSTSVAVYRDGYGALLLPDRGRAPDTRRPFPALPETGYDPDTLAWPAGNMLYDTLRGRGFDSLSAVTHRLMEQRVYGGDPYAFIVLHGGRPVAEAYRSGFGSSTRFLSWSLAKNITCTLAGLLAGEGRFDTGSHAGIPGWANDERSRITAKDLLQMQSGLEWNETYGTLSDVTRMLFTAGDFAAYASAKTAAYPAGTHWYYSSGTTNIVTALMRRSFESDSAYLVYPYVKLFHPLGMTSVVFETDARGHFAGSSYLYATARDFARFGLLWLGQGKFNGQQIVPAEWVDFAVTPAAHSAGQYGAFFWLNRGNRYPAAPPDMFFCIGVDGQRIFILPSNDLVVVVLGHSPEPDHALDFNRLLTDILRSFPA